VQVETIPGVRAQSNRQRNVPTTHFDRSLRAVNAWRRISCGRVPPAKSRTRSQSVAMNGSEQKAVAQPVLTGAAVCFSILLFDSDLASKELASPHVAAKASQSPGTARLPVT